MQEIKASGLRTVKLHESMPEPDYALAQTPEYRISRIGVLKAAFDVSARERAEALRNGVSLIKPKMGDRADTDLTPSEREGLLAAAVEVGNRDLDLVSKINIFKPIVDVPSQEGAEVVEDGIPFTLEMREHKMEEFIRALGRSLEKMFFPVKEEDVLLTRKVITEDMDNLERIEMLRAVIELPKNGKAEVVKKALLLMKSGMKFSDKVLLVRALSREPVPVDTETVGFAWMAINREIGNFLSEKILIRALAGIPVPFNEEDVLLALQVIDPDMGTFPKDRDR